MSIEWDKIQTKPDKGYKVTGHDLLALRENLFSLEKEIAKLKDEQEESNKKINTLSQKISNLENTIQEKNMKIKTLEDDLHHAEDTILKSEEDIARIKAEKEEELSHIKTAQEDQVANLKAENESTLSALKQQLEEQKSKAENEIRNLHEQIEEQLQTLKSNENIITERNTQIAELQAQINDLNAKIEELKEQIPKKPVYEKAEITEKGAACPKCGWTTIEEYKFVNGVKTLIRKYCPNTFCLWTSAEETKIAISMADEKTEEERPTLQIFQIKNGEIEPVTKIDSSMVAIIADYPQEIIWIWRGTESSRFEYAEATRQATFVKNEILKKPNAHIIRVNDGEEPNNFPTLS
ncbi:MAG: hypothetical protein ACTSQI_13885 [Candidatus Helarchaeota archaeon]